MGKVKVKPIETLVLEFEDGVEKNVKFSAFAMMVLDDEFEGFTTIFRDSQNKPFLNGAKLLYAGMKACNEDVTFEEVKRLTVNISIDDILDLFDFACETFGEVSEKKNKPAQKK